MLSLAIPIWFRYAKVSGSYSRILASIIIILVGRVGFDLVILPTKKQNDPYKIDAQKMSAITGTDPIYLTGPPEVKVDKVKFAGYDFATLTRNEPTYLTFQTSFYLSRYTNHILKYTTNRELEGFYISPEESTDPSKINVFYKFNNRLNKEDHWYILYKYNGQ